MVEKITSKDCMGIATSMQRNMEIQNRIYLAGRKKVIPSLHVYNDAAEYYDSANNMIHIGAQGPVEIFQTDEKKEFISALTYLFGHENQHVRSTASVPYANGIKQGAHEIVKYIMAKEGIVKHFRSDEDYASALEDLRKAKKIYVSMDSIEHVVAGLMNSVEDGRIERIRSNEFPGFAAQRKFFRGKLWMQGDMEYKKAGDMSDADMLTLILNEIWSLATVNLYTKGFVTFYKDEDFIRKEVEKYMPYIGRAVLASKCRKMAAEVVEMCKLLAPLIYEAVKAPDQNRQGNSQGGPSGAGSGSPGSGQQLTEDILKQILEQLANMDTTQMQGNTGEDEEEGDDTPNPVSGNSDLTVTLDDETYDKLEAQMKKNGQKGSSGGQSVMIKREHPKESQNGQKDGNGSQDGNTPNGQPGQEANGQPGHGTPQKMHNDSDSHAWQKGGGIGDASEESMRRAMEEAAAQCNEEVNEIIDDINQMNKALATQNRNLKEVADTDKGLSKKEIEDICGDSFEEVKRSYNLDQMLPNVLAARCKAFRKKTEKYFKSLKTPSVTYLENGSVDPSLIYGLALGEVGVFRKKGVDKVFDGCAYILIDNSGSMSGHRKTEALKAAAVIEEGFKGLIPVKIVAYDSWTGVNHEVIKGWEEVNRKCLCWNYAVHGRDGGGTPTHISTMIAEKELLNRSEEKKLLITITDGASNDNSLCKRAVDDCRKRGIQTYGIYIDGDISDRKWFANVYGQAFSVVCPVGELDEHLVRIVTKFTKV